MSSVFNVNKEGNKILDDRDEGNSTGMSCMTKRTLLLDGASCFTTFSNTIPTRIEDQLGSFERSDLHLGRRSTSAGATWWTLIFLFEMTEMPSLHPAIRRGQNCSTLVLGIELKEALTTLNPLINFRNCQEILWSIIQISEELLRSCSSQLVGRVTAIFKTHTTAMTRLTFQMSFAFAFLIL